MLWFAFDETILTLNTPELGQKESFYDKHSQNNLFNHSSLNSNVNDGRVLAQAGTWTIKASMPTPRSHFAVAEVNDVLYAVGGMKDRPCCPIPWTTKAPMT